MAEVIEELPPVREEDAEEEDAEPEAAAPPPKPKRAARKQPEPPPEPEPEPEPEPRRGRGRPRKPDEELKRPRAPRKPRVEPRAAVEPEPRDPSPPVESRHEEHARELYQLARLFGSKIAEMQQQVKHVKREKTRSLFRNSLPT